MQQTVESLPQALTLKPREYIDRFLTRQRGSRGFVKLQPTVKLSRPDRDALTGLKGSVDFDERTGAGTLRATKKELRDLVGGQHNPPVSDRTLTARGRVLWGKDNPRRLFDRQILTDEATGTTWWILTLRRNGYHWLETPAPPKPQELAALEQELAEKCEGYQAPRQWYSTPFGLLADGTTAYTELSDGKLLSFPTGEVIDRPAAICATPADSCATPAESRADIKNERARVQNTEETRKNTEKKRAAPQAAPSLELSIQELMAKIDADPQLRAAWRSDGLAHGVDINTNHGESVCEKFLTLHKRARTFEAWCAKWRTWCAQER